MGLDFLRIASTKLSQSNQLRFLCSSSFRKPNTGNAVRLAMNISIYEI